MGKKRTINASSEKKQKKVQELNPIVDFVLWMVFVGVFAFFYLGAVVSPVTLYQSARPDASTAYYDIHPEQNSPVKLLEYPTHVLVSWADGEISAGFLYLVLGLLASALLWLLAAPRTALSKALSFLPLGVLVWGLQEFWLWSVTVLWLLTICLALLLSLKYLFLKKRRWSWGNLPQKWVRSLQTALILGMALLIAISFVKNRQERNKLLVLSQLRQGEYAKALARASTMESLDSRLACSVRYLLYHQNQLLENLFLFPLNQEIAILPVIPFAASEPYYKTMLEMGFVNSAEHFATEALELVGDAPEILYDLGFIYTLKGEPIAARVYWGYLAKNPVWASRAREMVEASLADPTLKNHPQAERYYRYLYTENYFYTQDPPEFRMRQSLLKNPTHRMALEYLAAEYLGHKNHEGIARLIPAFRALNYPRLPRHIEEALCLALQDNPSLEMAGYQISQETQGRFKDFCLAYQKASQQKEVEQVFAVMGPAYGDTYWFYQIFSVTGRFKIQTEPEEES